MNAFAQRVPVALSLVCLASVLGGCNAGSVSPEIPASSAHFTRPLANTSGVKIWASEESSSKVFGLSSGAKRVLDVISTERQPVKGGDPLTLKVDHDKNLFVTDVSGGNAGVIQEFKDGKFTRAYAPGCAVSKCSSFTGVLSDSAVDKNNVFAIMKQIQYKVATYTVVGSGYEYWPNGNPSATPVEVLLPSDCSAICFYDAGDVDSSGNLWLRDYGGGGYGVAEITDPTTRPSMSQILPFTFMIDSGDIAGFYIGNAGMVLNVGDSSHKIYQYALPLKSNGSPFNTLTPCSQGCDPHGFGFNSNDTLIAAGDGTAPAHGWVDIGRVAKNHWKKVTNPKFSSPLSSAVYTPSDK
jgi:hypothetical protein